MNPDEFVALAKSVPAAVMQDAYGDLASGPLKQAGKLGEDLTKAIRLVLFPLQFAGALQDRLEGYIARAVRQVPESRRIAPPESLTLPTMEKLRFQESSNPITDLYINLLARAMDGERVGEAHPAFLQVITQLAPDEVTFLNELSHREYTLVLKMDEQWRTPTVEDVQRTFNESGLPPHLVVRSCSLIFDYKVLNQSDLFRVFLQHLYFMGLVEYSNEPTNEGEYKGHYRWKRGAPNFLFVQFSSFGRLFYKACVS